MSDSEPALNAVVLHRIDVTPDLMILRVVPVGWRLPAFTPGQFAVLGLPASAPRMWVSEAEGSCEPKDPTKLIRRAYSIASSSKADEYFEFYISLVRTGELTPRLFALKVGDKLWLGKKVGGLFTLDGVPPDRHVVFVATSTGIAPYMSMLRTHLAHDYERHYAVIHGAKCSWDLGYHAELVTISRLRENFAYLPVVSRPYLEPVPWSGLTGYVQNVWSERKIRICWGFDPSPTTTHVFLCGNPNMTDTMIGILTKEGYRPYDPATGEGEIHYEKYW